MSLSDDAKIPIELVLCAPNFDWSTGRAPLLLQTVNVHNVITDLINKSDRLATELAAARKDAERLQEIATLIGVIFAHGNFKAETYNESELEKLLRENGTFWESAEDYESSPEFAAAIAAQPTEPK